MFTLDRFCSLVYGSRMNSATTSQLQNVSRETFLPLAAYVALLLKWNKSINLIGPATESDVWARHIDDSSQLVALIPSNATSVVDLGSGAGLPGLVIAMLRPELQVTLVEQDQRKAAFLKEAKRALGLHNVSIAAMDIAKVEAKFDVVTARALAPLSQLLAMAKPLMEEGATCIFPKGANHQSELAEAAKYWGFEHTLKSSATNGQSSLITITKLTKFLPQN
jgi:16S rRNA (guanine527-N7)-methyltransferase